jgi:transcriptional regulator with XRE-family HTH domain
MAPQGNRFGEILRQTREQANQTAEVMAILLSMEPDEYLAIEAGLRFPDDDTVRRLCMMMEWNYIETQRLIRNEMSSPGRLTAPPVSNPRHGSHGGASAGGAGGMTLGQSAGSNGARAESLGARMREVRQFTGQSADIIAALLHISPEQYARLEDGEAPSDDLLRRISMVYTWNFQELVSLQRAEQAHNLQPRLVGNPFPGTGAQLEKLRAVCRDLEAQFPALPESDQTMVLAQLDLVRGTVAQALLRLRPKAGAQAGPNAASNAIPGSGPERGAGVRRRNPSALPPPSPEDRKLFS